MVPRPLTVSKRRSRPSQMSQKGSGGWKYVPHFWQRWMSRRPWLVASQKGRLRSLGTGRGRRLSTMRPLRVGVSAISGSRPHQGLGVGCPADHAGLLETLHVLLRIPQLAEDLLGVLA